MCLSPITRKVECQGRSKIVTHPCGKCLECVSQYQNDWANRLSDEFKQWKYAYFGTFTYDNAHLPYVDLLPSELDDKKFYTLSDSIQSIPLNSSLIKARKRNDGFTDYLKPDYLLTLDSVKVPLVSKYDMQCYIKRIRTNFERKYNRELDMIYFCCSEYGPCTLRPHYHIIFMTNEMPELFNPVVKSCYGLGAIRDFHRLVPKNGSISDACAYTAKYCCKPTEFENPYVVAGLAPKPFRLMSKGIGKAERERIIKIANAYNGNRWDILHGRQYFGYSVDFLEFVRTNVTHKFQAGKSGDIFQVKLPRYYSDAWFPQKDFFTPIINEHNEIVYKNSRRKDSESRLCLAYSRYVADRYIQICDRSLRELKALYPTKTDAEIIHLAEIQRVQNIKERASKKLQNFVKFYGKSFFRGM